MLKIILLMVSVFGYSQCQTVITHVRLVDNSEYVLDILQDVVTELEKTHFRILTIPDISINLNEQVFGEVYNGTVTFGNAFVPSIERLAVLESSVQQAWLRNSTTSVITVESRGTLLMYELALGFSVTVNLEDGTVRHYTAVFKHEVVNFAFAVINEVNVMEITYSVNAVVPATNRIISFMPTDQLTDVLTTMFAPALTHPGILAWADDIFLPMLLAAADKFEYPRLCYDCPA